MSQHFTDMKLSKRNAKKEFEVGSDDGPRFPHGLSLRFDDVSLTKLGFDSLPEVGEEFIVVGVGQVTSASVNKRQSGVDRDMSIQLQKIEIGPVSGKEETAVSAVDAGIAEANTDHKKG